MRDQFLHEAEIATSSVLQAAGAASHARAVRQIRIAVPERPAPLRRLVEGLASQPDLDLASVAASEVALMLDASCADVVVTPMPGGVVPAVAERLLDEYPWLGIVCVDLAARRGLVCRLGPSRRPVDAGSPSAVAAAIRSAAEDVVVRRHP